MAFVEDDFDQPGFHREPKLNITYLGLTRYYDTFDHYVIPPMNMSNILGEVLAGDGLWQLRISETQKFRHVTSFFNSKREEPFSGEERILVASPKVPEDQKPEMSAYEVTELVLKAVSEGIAAVREAARTTECATLYEADRPARGQASDDAGAKRLEDTYDVIILNYVNGDMVGHTGVFEAAVKAIEAVDDCVGRVVHAVLERDGIALVTADHGNAEQMLDPETHKIQTAHTTNEVDFICISAAAGSISLRKRGVLSDIGPTILHLLKIPVPAEMTAQSLIV
jgi:2,3-bisphosphoglycerate-independent phosphoglycerate mutase